MRVPHSYIVRIYRRGYRSLSGIVEDTCTNRTLPFRDTDELVDLLRGAARRGDPRKRSPKSRSTQK